MATLERLLRDAFGAARDVDAGRAATRPVTWVRVLRARVPAFDALDPGDLVIVPAASLGVVAPTDPQIDELAAALAGAGIPAVLLVHADGDPPGDVRLGRLGERLAATEVTAIDLGVADPQAVERRLLATLLDGRRGADATTGDGATPEPGTVVRSTDASAWVAAPARPLLEQLDELPAGPALARELLAPLLTGRVERQRERVETLAAVLGSQSLADAGTRLGLHRNTLAYRLARIESATGWDLADPDLRLALTIAARIFMQAAR